MLSLSTLVGVAGFEPATTWTQTMHSTRLNYTPMADHRGFEPLLSDLESDVLPLTLMACGASEGARTLDIHVGNVALYQLRYTRMELLIGLEPTTC